MPINEVLVQRLNSFSVIALEISVIELIALMILFLIVIVSQGNYVLIGKSLALYDAYDITICETRLQLVKKSS